jgi:hypothetical protein
VRRAPSRPETFRAEMRVWGDPTGTDVLTHLGVSARWPVVTWYLIDL